MSTETLLRQAVKGALAFGAAGGMVGAGAALAQTAAPAPGSATNLQEIVVTGSHIPKTSIATAEPIVTINRQQIEDSGFTTLGAVLTNLAQGSSAINQGVTNNVSLNSAGATFLNIHNLGSQRLLVLVNGQRWVPTVSGSVDITTIPAAAVQRIEILLEGASAIYGSDAIAGVVNIILVRNYNGAQASAYMGIYDATGDGGGWDGKTQDYSFTVGTSNDRSSILLSAGYRERDPIWMVNRNYSKEPYYHTKQYFTGSGSTAGGHLTGFATNTALAGVNGASSCTPIPGSGGYNSCNINGPFAGPNANTHPFSGADRYNYVPKSYLYLPDEQWYGYTQGHYDLIPEYLTFDFGAFYQSRNVMLNGAALPVTIGANGPLKANGLPIGISGNAAYNPFGVDLVPFGPSSANSSNATYVAWCSKYGSGAGGTCSSNPVYLLGYNFRPTAASPRNQYITRSTWRFSGGFSGGFQALGNQWNWNADYIFSRLNTGLTADGDWDMANTQEALSGACIDQTTGQGINGCVPLDIFQGGDALSKQMLNYVEYHRVASTQVNSRNYIANISGNLFNSWYAGPWGIAAGFEYYEIDGHFNQDPVTASGNGSSNIILSTNGREASDAEYAELNIPWMSHLPGAYSLSTDVAWRWSQYKVDGLYQPNVGAPITSRSNKYDVNTGRVQLKYYPIKTLLLRATWSQGFRVPSISELFAGVAQSYSPVTDPCTTPGGGVTSLPGCPANANQPNAQILTNFAGSPNLGPESSISRSLGFVWSPELPYGSLDINADYYKVEITNAVTSIGPQLIMNRCYSDQHLFCDRIQRSPGGVITSITAGTVNAGSLHTNGWDVGFDYKFPSTPVGTFDLTGNANFVQFYTFCNTVTGQATCFNSAGTVYSGVPKHKYNIGLNWNYGPWSATWNVTVLGALTGEGCILPYGVSGKNFFGPGLDLPNCPIPPGPKNPDANGTNNWGSVVYHDVQANYTVAAWNTTFTLGVQNLFDKHPPFAQEFINPNYQPLLYRVAGRFIYGKVQVRF